LDLFVVFSVFGGSGDFGISDFSGFRGSKKGGPKSDQKLGKRQKTVKKGGLSLVTHFYIVRRFSGGVFLGWGSFGVWGKTDFSDFSQFSDPFLETPKLPDPPQNHPTPGPHPPLPVYIYIYRERERERERHGLGDFWGWVFLGFPDEWALPVASCLCRAYTMPTHYNTLKEDLWTLTPGRVF